MGGAEVIFFVIVAFSLLFAVIVLRKIFKKKSKSGKKAKAKTESSGGGMPKADLVKAEKMKPAKAPKINKEKLRKIENDSAHVVPAFSREELDSERMEQIRKDVEKDLSHQKRPIPFSGYGQPNFGFPVTPQTRPTQQAKPITFNNFDLQPQKPIVQNASITPSAAKQEDKDFIEMLKKKGIVKQNQSFGESLIVKEAIDTPASKQAMKKKRQKWM